MSNQDELSRRRSNLSAAKRALLENWMRNESRAPAEAQAIPPGSQKGPAPLSFTQERLWFLDQLEPGNPFYNIPAFVSLQGPLNLRALEQSLNEIVQRHEVLRTSFHNVGGQPVQVIAPSQTLKLSLVDLRGLPESERKAEARRLATEEARRPFDLAQGPLLRSTLLCLGEEEYVFLLTMHHIVSDGWSVGVLIREMTALYEAFSTGNSSPLPELPIQYTDFAHWQRQRLQGEFLESQLSYWRQQLADLPVLQLPTDRPRPAVQSFRGASQSVVLPKSLSEALTVLSRQENTTLFMTLLAAFKALLYHYTREEDIAVGSPIANRNRAEIEGLIGFFVNSLVMRTDLSANPSFRELLGRVREVTLGAYAHQDLPFDKLVEELKPERNASQNPLFQVMFAVQNAPMPALGLSGLTLSPLELPGLTLSPLGVESGTTRFDLELHLWEKPEGLSGTLVYSTDLFDSPKITRMLGHYQTLLEAIVAHPEQRLSDLSLLREAERQQLLVEWNNTKTDYPQDRCIHELFEEQVERTPDAIAVVFEDKTLTYRELNRRANRLAHHLRELGVRPEVLVGICMERSLEMIIGMLGILKAGGAYVPLDPAYPAERLAFMLEDTRAPVLLTQQRLVADLPIQNPKSGIQNPVVVCLDEDWEAVSHEPDDNLSVMITAGNLAYVIYTSGSTGRPKGVSVTHRGVVRLVKETNYVELTAKDVFLQFAPISFDASTFEVWGCLLNGAKLVVSPPRTPSLDELGEVVKQSGVTTLWLTAALFHQMVEGPIESLSAVKQLLAGGDVLSAPHVKKVLKELPGCRLINGYGPTENTTFTCCYPVRLPEQVGESVSIGRPIANSQIYISDRNFNPVPVGVYGELSIGGDGLARGYLNNPELTAEKFIPDPFGAEPGARLYRTGDIARYLPDGNIEFLGRIDNQVKIRGFRIELGEIEAVLVQHPCVQEAVVLARDEVEIAEGGSRMADGEGENPKSKTENLKSAGKRLVAYIVPKENQPTTSELRGFLKEKLPEYMIPSAFVTLDALPLTPNGKVDRRGLPAPQELRPGLETAYVAPRTEVERTTAKIWQEVLHVEKAGIHDNFFDLGGHSLLMVQVHSKLARVFDKDISIVEMFQYPTIASISKYLSHEQNEPPSFQKIHDRAKRQKEAINRQKQLGNKEGQTQ